MGKARRVESQRREHRLDFLREIFGEPGVLCGVSVLRVDELDSVGCERREDQLIEQLVLIFDQCERALVNGGQLLRHAHAVRPATERAEFQPLLQAGDANLEEFVEVRAGDPQKRMRSSNGNDSSCACASTRQLKSRNDSSRLM